MSIRRKIVRAAVAALLAIPLFGDTEADGSGAVAQIKFTATDGTVVYVTYRVDGAGNSPGGRQSRRPPGGCLPGRATDARRVHARVLIALAGVAEQSRLFAALLSLFERHDDEVAVLVVEGPSLG